MRGWIRTWGFLLLCVWPLVAAMALVLYIELTHDDPYGGAPWLLLPGLVLCVPASIVTGLASLAARGRRGEPGDPWLGATVYVLGCAAVAMLGKALLQH